MKKLLTLIVVFALSMLAFCSCEWIKSKNEPKTAAELWERINEEMDSLESMRAEVTGKMTFEVSDIKFTAEVSGHEIFSGLNTDKPYYYEYSETVVKADKADTEEKVTAITAYDNGILYVSNSTKDQSVKLCSELSKADFIQFISSSEFSVSPDKCTAVDFAKNEDSSWSLGFSGFSYTELERMLDILEFNAADYGATVTDLKFSVSADEDFRVKKFIIDIICKDSDTPLLHMEMAYSEFNQVAYSAFEGAGYKKVDDVRVMRWMSKSMSAAKRSDNNTFTLDVKQALSTKAGVELDKYSENDIVSYKVIGGEFRYNVIAKTDDQRIEIEYKDGEQKIYLTSNGAPQVTKQTEDDARAFIYGLLNSSGYDQMNVSDIKKVSDNTYEIKCSIKDTSAYSSLIKSFGDTFVGYDYVILVTCENDRVVRIESDLVIKGYKYNYTVESDLKFSN